MSSEFPESLLRLPDVCRRTGLPRSTLYDHIARGNFPRPIHLTERTRAWPESDIARWIDDRIAASRERGAQ